jgi:hemolysin III
LTDTSILKPRLRGRLHQVAFFVSVPAGISLVIMAASGVARVSAAIYAMSLSGLYAASAAFHRVNWRPTTWKWMRRLDHSMIFVLIAGTYTPYALLVLPAPWSTVVLATVWGGGLVGIALRMLTRGLNALEQTLYLGLGWVALLTLPVSIGRLGWIEAILMFSGGLLYTAGAIIFRLRRPDPNPAVFGYHEVWHSMVIGASLCHYTLILLLVIRG